MSGKNPYLQTSGARLPERKYSITFAPSGRKIEVDPANLPSAGTGEPGSILDIALASGIEIEHACGGVCACATCHVIVKEGLDSCSPASDSEEDMLERAIGLTSQSRLSCQCVPDGSKNVVVEIQKQR